MRGQFNQTMADTPWVAHYPRCVPAHLDYPDEPAFFLLEEAARREPSRIACQYYHQKLTYEELHAQARRFADALRRRGLEPGQRVGILLPNTPEYLIALFGTWMAGGITVPLNPLMVAEEISDLLTATDARQVVCLDLMLPQLAHPGGFVPEHVYVTSLKDRLPWWSRMKYRLAQYIRLGILGSGKPRTAEAFAEVLDLAEGIDPIRPDTASPAHILATGGTTGHPKAVTLSHQNLLSNAWQLWHWVGRTSGHETMLGVLPFFHSYGMTTCAMAGTAMTATLILHHRFQVEPVLKLIETMKPTVVPAVPAMLVAFNKAMREKKYDLSSIRYVISGGAALDQKVSTEFSEHSGAVVVEGYGLSEASPVTHAGPLDGSARPGTIGLPLPDTEAMIVDAETGTHEVPVGEVGELLIRGPQVMLGYWNDPEATAETIRDGWLHTGDLAKRDEDGFFRIVDRKKDLIITSGFNVYPTDVEHVLARYNGIDDVGVLGVPDEQRGELVKAVVVPKEGVPFDRDAFDAFAKEHLAAHKRPRVVEVTTEKLPRNMLGKLLRRVLRDQHTKAEAEPAPKKG